LGLLQALARARGLKRLLPVGLKRWARRLLPLEQYDPIKWAAEDPNAGAEEESTYPARVDLRLGIIKEFTQIHSYYIGACRELGVPYRLVDLSGPDWLDQVGRSGCDAFLVRPSGQITVWKQMFDERLRVLSHDLGKILFPSYDEIWFYESKRRMHYWLAAHGMPRPKTWVFYDRDQALDFADRADLPTVFKADLGSGSMGVRILRTRSGLRRLITKAFRKGFLKTGADPRDRQWGTVLLQEYLADPTEWRMIRVGESYFGYQKVRKGDFHSGSHVFRYGRPPTSLLRLTRSVTETGGFLSMALDCFVTSDGRCLVNEMQTTFGLHVSDGLPMEGGRPGRLVYDPAVDDWQFEEGLFCRNKLCNLRVQTLVERLQAGRACCGTAR
jgi:glutathione synthase/RimK-type ligase-like ATP-grasp enzyme